MKKIFKYELYPLKMKMHLELPKGADILTVQMQRDKAVIWAIVDPENANEDYHFICFGTGQENLEDTINTYYMKYIGTFQQDNGYLVLHLFLDILKSYPSKQRKRKVACKCQKQ